MKVDFEFVTYALFAVLLPYLLYYCLICCTIALFAVLLKYSARSERLGEKTYNHTKVAKKLVTTHQTLCKPLIKARE